MAAEKITEISFNLTAAEGKPHDKNAQIAFKREHPDLWLMIRPHRPHDLAANRYPDENAKAVGDRAMKAWFEYLAGKGFVKTLNSWRSILKTGRSLMVVCEDPGVFDREFVPPVGAALPADFWDEFERSRVAIDRRFERPEERPRLAKIVKDAAAAIRMNSTQRKPEAAQRALVEWKSTPLDQHSAVAPPKISVELRAKLGISEAK